MSLTYAPDHNACRRTTTRIPFFGLSVISGSDSIVCPGTSANVTRWTERATQAQLKDDTLSLPQVVAW